MLSVLVTWPYAVSYFLQYCSDHCMYSLCWPCWVLLIPQNVM